MKATNKWTKITVCKYETYQSASFDECQAEDEQPTNKRQADDKQPTTLEECNKGKKKERKNANVYDEAVERIYALYPSTTKRTDGTNPSLRTARKDKDKISRLLSSGEYTESSLSEAIRRYVSETKPEYLKQFQSFLNNIPDYSQQKPQDASGDGQAPATLTKEQDIWMAAHPTKEEIKKWFEENFYPFHLKNEGETDEAYFVRIRPDYEAAKQRWIDNRVLYRKQKY